VKDLAFTGSIGVLVAVALASVALRVSDSGASTSVPAAVATAAAAEPAATASPTPRPTATPTAGEILADAVRTLDLAAWADALAVHRERTGSYPSSRAQFVRLCAAPSDPTCELRSIDPALKFGDGVVPYWYRSDGTSYTLVTHVLFEPDDNSCPDDLPAHLAEGPIACFSSEDAP
jgi:hypothetical protein